MSEASARAFLARQGLAVERLAPVGGGDICRAWRVETRDGPRFLKQRCDAPEDFFALEAAGLEALAAGADFRVPAVLGHDEAHLLLAWQSLVPRGDDVRLGRALAALHARDWGVFGWERDNYLGRTPQPNPRTAHWATFLAEARLGPLLARLAGESAGLAAAGRDLLHALPELLGDHAPHAALVHGDLWAGNAAFLPDGTPVLFDPAVHWADRECDLAMMTLFGGFPERCLAAYEAALPLPPGAARRRPLYQLYHLLNHAVLFGGGYVERSRRVIASLLR